MMTLLARDGTPTLVPSCSYALTAIGCVSRIYTDMAVFLIEDKRVAVQRSFGPTLLELQHLLRVPLWVNTPADSDTRQPS
jgi:3-oxoadipate CoA-transferase, beta subunit